MSFAEFTSSGGGLAEFTSSGGGGGADLSFARKAPETNYDTKSIQSAGAASIAEQYGAAAVVAPPQAARQSLRPTPGREVTALSLPTGINETFHNPDDSLDVHAAHVNGTLDTHGSTTKPLDFSLDQGSVHDAGEFKEFVHHDVDAKTHSTGLDISHADRVTKPLDFALDIGQTHDAGRRQSFRSVERDAKTHSTGFNVSHADEIIKPLDNSLDFGYEHADRYTGRQSQQFRSLQRGVKPPPIQKRVKKKRQKGGFNVSQHKTGRGSVWKEMGRLAVEPYDQRKVGDLDLGDVVEESQQTQKKKANEKVNYNRMAELAKSKRKVAVEQHHEPRSEQEQYRQVLNSKAAYRAPEMYWKPPENFRAFDPSAYARDRAAKINKADLQRWRPDDWTALPDFCFKPTRDVGECD